MPVCDHCKIEFPERDIVRDEIDGTARVFCCHGCNGIYRFVHNEGLDDFYDRRRDWTPGPAEERTVDTAAFIEHLRPSGAEIETDLVIEGIRCASCVWLNEKVLQKTEGVTFARVNYATHRARVRWDPAKIDIAAILKRIQSIGYQPKPFIATAFEQEQKKQARDLLVRFGTASFFSMQLMLFSIALYAGYFQGIDDRTKTIFHFISMVLTLPVLFYSGWPILRSSISGLRNLHFNMDVLISAGALSAFGYSVYQIATNGEVYFDTAAMIVTLILLGRYIEAGAKTRASETISRLVQLEPKEARRLEIAAIPEPTQERLHAARRTLTPVSRISVGDLIEVVPGEKVPLDGIVLSGSSEINEAMLTGESRPSAKTASSAVYGGTQNLYGSVIFQVTRTGKDTVLSQIILTVEDAQSRRAPIQSAADRVVGWFVPAVLFIAACTFAGWLSYGAPLSRSVMNAVSVLVIACPCALGLATPLAILIGTSNGAARGILIKGGDVVEKTAAVNSAVLDKTGTLTEGKPVASVIIGIGIPDEEALRIACSLEAKSEHSLGRALVSAGRGMPLFEVSDFAAVPGKGVRGTITNRKIQVGSRSFCESSGADFSLLATDRHTVIDKTEKSGSTVIYLCENGSLRGLFVITDRVRPESAEAVRMLSEQGCAVAMVTGDNEQTAQSVAEETGIHDVRAQVTPIGKAEVVRKQKETGSSVLMAGDGINDAPALVEATVGVAMGRATDIALESADIVIMRSDLRLVADAVALCKKTFSVVRQNIFWAFFYNAVVIPLAIFGILHPIVAAAAMAFSSLSVVGNSLRARLS